VSIRPGNLASRIVIDHRKFTEYVLNPDHPDGKSKASGFQRMLGYTIQNYQELVAQLEVLVPEAEDQQGETAMANGTRLTFL